MQKNKKILEILKKSHYQRFDFLEDSAKDSNTSKKYELSKLDLFDIKDKKILDIGCNVGYFLFKLLDKDPKELIGIDYSQFFIDLAVGLNEEYFKSNKIKFISKNIFNFETEIKFDLIICFSTFHYFVDTQLNFLSKIYNLLEHQGKFLLEVETFPENDKSFILKSVRPAHPNLILDYPNHKQLEFWFKDKFKIEDKYNSVFQVGSLFPRYFYLLSKIT